MSSVPDTAGSTQFRACAYPVVWRTFAGMLVAVSRGSLPVIAVTGVLAEQPIPLLGWVRLLVVFSLLPAIAVWLIERTFAVDVEVRAAEIVLGRSDLQLEIPCTAIDRVTPWTLSLPGPGFSLWMRSGRRLTYGLQVDDPTPLLSALAEIGGVQAARSVADHRNLVYARALGSVARWRWFHLVAKFGLFALVPTAVWFNAHQHIAYGGLLGQYYLEGLGPYLKTFGVSWSLVSIYLVLYASVWRGLAEGVALLAAGLAPARAVQVRELAEIICRVVYYCGVPLIVVTPFFL